MSLDLKIQSPTEWTAIKNQEPPFDTMLLVSGNPLGPEEGSIIDEQIVVLAFLSSRSNTYIRLDSEAECLLEWMVPIEYHVIYNPQGEPVKVASLVTRLVPETFD